MGQTESIISPYTLSTPKGGLQGLEYQNKQTGKAVCRRFAGIPYAQPPVGQLRWRRPQPLDRDFSFNLADGSPGDFTKFGAICPQLDYGHSKARFDGPGAAPAIENVQSEDCLYLNIWTPTGEPPKGGWPVQFHIHGGWLQVGNANQCHDQDPFDLYKHTRGRVIVVPTYRLNLFGFLAGQELASLSEDPASSNYGLWDQRAALEWTAQNIGLFGGSQDNITVGGLSAGANSTFYQLYYDTYLPPERQLIKRIYLWSNAVAIQPDTTEGPALTAQFNELCSVFNLSESLSAPEKIQALRKVSSEDLVAAVSKLKMHTFRTNTDNSFVSRAFLSSLHSGAFTTKLAENRISVLLGEVSDEALLYKLVNPPKNKADLIKQVENYYPRHVVDGLLPKYEMPDDSETDADKWATVFSEIVADGQVYASLRGLVRALLDPPAGKPVPRQNLFRYRISWRAKGLDPWLDPAVRVCHAADTPIWWGSGWRAGFTDEDGKKALQLLKPFDQFFAGEEVEWAKGHENSGPESIKFMDVEGVIHDNYVDELWVRGLDVFDATWAAQKDRVASA